MTVTINDPTPLLAKGRDQVFIGPTVADETAPKVSEFTMPVGAQISCDLDGFEATVDQQMIEDAPWCLSYTIETPGPKKFAMAALEVLYDPQNPADPNYQAYLRLKEGTEHVLLHRRGLLNTDLLKAGDVVDVYNVKVGAASRVPATGDEQQKIRSRVVVTITKAPVYDVKVA